MVLQCQCPLSSCSGCCVCGRLPAQAIFFPRELRNTISCSPYPTAHNSLRSCFLVSYAILVVAARTQQPTIFCDLVSSYLYAVRAKQTNSNAHPTAHNRYSVGTILHYCIRTLHATQASWGARLTAKELVGRDSSSSSSSSRRSESRSSWCRLKISMGSCRSRC